MAAPTATMDKYSGQTPAPPYSPRDPSAINRPEAAYSTHPQPGYQMQSTYVTPLERLQENPEEVDCPFCQRRALTRVQKEDSNMTMLAGGLLCLVCICLACLPCIMGCAQNVDHYCGACGKQLTHKPHDGMTQVVEAARARRGDAPAPHQVPSQYSVPQSYPQQQPQLEIQPESQQDTHAPEIQQDTHVLEMFENGAAVPPKS